MSVTIPRENVKDAQSITTFKASDENIVFESHAAQAGEELKSSSGLILGKRETAEIPLVARVVSVGENVPNPENLLNKVVLIPNGRIINVPDPRMLRGEISSTDPDCRKLSVTHWKNIQVVYE